MRKLIFNHVSVEVTRRCNLKCQHCLRGEAQEVDIDLRTIDALVEQTAKIYNLAFTGGEPTLNVPAMAYTLKMLRSHKVPLHSVEVATNGMLLSSELIETVRGFSRYIAEWGTSGTAVSVGISKDRYHLGADPDAAFDFYRRELASVATVKFMRQGDAPVAIGRGRGLTGALPLPAQGIIPRQIETLEAGDLWPQGESLWAPPRDGEKIICCRLNLTAHGDLTVCSNHEGEYSAEDNHRNLVICNLSPSTATGDHDIDHGITEYNKRFPSNQESVIREENMQMAEYMKHPKRAIDELRWAHQLMQLDPFIKAQILAQCPGMEEEQFEILLGLLDIAECLPEEHLTKALRNEILRSPEGEYAIFENI